MVYQVELPVVCSRPESRQSPKPTVVQLICEIQSTGGSIQQIGAQLLSADSMYWLFFPL